MITPAFTKLQRSIVTSSVWMEADTTRLVWITLLALCDRDGVTRCSPRSLAHQARVSEEACAKAIKIFEAPDPESKSSEFEGRRVERVEGGYLVLSYPRILAEGAREERKEYNRGKQAESRARKKALDADGLPKAYRKPIATAPPERRLAGPENQGADI